MKIITCVVLISLCGIPSLFAKDFGLILDLTPGYESSEGFDNMGAEKFSFSGTARPWFSTPLAAAADLYISAGLSSKYEQEEFSFAPELYRTELGIRPGETQSLSFGRIYYSDPLGFIAEGLFDGLSWTNFTDTGSFSLGAYYTGFLYKKTAYITITDDELGSYQSELDYGDFMETYFAPSRALASLSYSNAFGDIRLNAALLGQVDVDNLSDDESHYHSEYLAFKVAIPWKNIFVFEAGAAGELIQTTGEDLLFGLAGDIKFSWMPGTEIQDRLSLGARYSSGRWGGSSFAEFRPLTTETQGQVLRAKLSGLSVIEASYTARLSDPLALDISAAYFIRNDLATYTGSFAGERGYFLGGEGFARIIWSPVSDIRFNLGGGAFFPSLGDSSPDSKPMWLVNLNCIIAVL
jgi:hypothetical protein